MFTLLLFFALLGATNGWVTTSQSVYGAQIDEIQDQMRGAPSTRFVQAELGGLWTLPADPADTAGLGGGISFAWDPALCDRLLPRFREDYSIFGTAVSCTDLKAAVHRAFASWSSNHKDIHFVDVTGECALLGQTGEDCELSEVWITSSNPAASPSPPPSAASPSPSPPPDDGASVSSSLSTEGTAAAYAITRAKAGKSASSK